MRSFTFAGLIFFLVVTAVSASTPGAGFLSGSAARGLSRQRNATSARGPCAMSLIQMAEPATVKEYSQCIGDLVNTTDFTVAGSNFDVLHTCWCQHDMQPVMDDFSCCGHPDYALLCAASCKPDCKSTHATECLEKCPAICLEGDYAPKDICQNCAECMDVMKCIVQHSKERNEADDPEHPNLCDDREFDSSSEFLEWQDCYVDHPMRTHWHRTNAEHHCYCKADLKSAAEKHGCCGASWAGKICNDQCAHMTSMCETTEAQECMQECKTKCAALHSEMMVDECKTHCIDEASKCHKYKICEPVGPFEHDYICDDGSKAPTNGCCAVSSRTGLPSCPALCDSGSTHMLHHGFECQCQGCPASFDEAKSKFNNTLSNSLWEHGQATLTDIARRHKLDHPNQKMQKMMKGRNEEIMQAFEKHKGGIDAAFQKIVSEISQKWHELIEIEAKRQKEFGDETTKPPPVISEVTQTNIKEKVKEEEGGAGVVIIILAAVGGLLLVLAILIMIYKIKKTSKGGANPGHGASGISPNDGDPNVVVGRPVEGEAAKGATAGAPVAMGEGADSKVDKDSKGDVPPQFSEELWRHEARSQGL